MGSVRNLCCEVVPLLVERELAYYEETWLVKHKMLTRVLYNSLVK